MKTVTRVLAALSLWVGTAGAGEAGMLVTENPTVAGTDMGPAMATGLPSVAPNFQMLETGQFRMVLADDDAADAVAMPTVEVGGRDDLDAAARLGAGLDTMAIDRQFDLTD